MNCLYCNKLCEIEEKFPDIEYWNCHNHKDPIYYTYDVTNQHIVSVSLNCSLNNENYSCHLTYAWNKEANCIIIKFLTDWEAGIAILEFDFIPPNITPENISNKLITLLTWS